MPKPPSGPNWKLSKPLRRDESPAIKPGVLPPQLARSVSLQRILSLSPPDVRPAPPALKIETSKNERSATASPPGSTTSDNPHDHHYLPPESLTHSPSSRARKRKRSAMFPPDFDSPASSIPAARCQLSATASAEPNDSAVISSPTARTVPSLPTASPSPPPRDTHRSESPEITLIAVFASVPPVADVPVATRTFTPPAATPDTDRPETSQTDAAIQTYQREIAISEFGLRTRRPRTPAASSPSVSVRRRKRAHNVAHRPIMGPASDSGQMPESSLG